MKSKTLNILLTIMSFVIVFIAIYSIIFTYHGTTILISGTIIIATFLYRFLKRKLKWLSLVLVGIPLLTMFAFTTLDIKNHIISNTQVETIKVGNMTREFRYFSPQNLEASKNKTVIIALHGFKQTVKGMERLTGFNELASKYNFLVVYPEGYKKGWNDGDDTKEATKENIDDVSFISAVIDWAKTNYQIEKVILTGFSNGGFFAVDAGCQLSNKIDVVIPVASGVWDGNMKNCSTTVKQQVLFVHTQNDPMTDISRFGPSISSYAQKIGCSKKMELIDQNSEQNWSLKQFDCENKQVRHLVINNGGHIWPGGNQYMPKFLIGKAIKEPKLSNMIVDFYITNNSNQ